MTTSSKVSTSHWLPTAALIAAFASMVWLRFDLVNSTVSSYTDCGNDCRNWIIPAYDVGILALIFILIGAAYIAPRWTKPLLTGLGILILVSYGIDLFVFLLLHHRLLLTDILRFAGDVQLNGTVALPQLRSFTGILLFFLLISSCAALILLITKAPRKPKKALIFLILSPVLLAARAIPDDFNHVSSNLYKDVITNNLPHGSDAPYSATTSVNHLFIPEPALTCITSKSTPQPVILLVMESLSLYQSQYLSGLDGFLPELDLIAKKYSHLEYFYANGFTTDGGLIALLTGHVPLPSINRYRSTSAYLGYEKPKQDLFNRLAKAQIPATYFRSADQGFLNTGDWLRQLNFNFVDGPENTFYNGMPRGSFNEPGDKALYQRYLQWFDKERTSDVFFSVIQTTTTHPPFIVPGTELRGEEAAFRYADQALGDFVRELEHRKFFDHGTLVITGDHRSMTARRRNEWERIGRDAYARVPAILVSAAHRNRGAIRGTWQQTDFIPSLLDTMGLESCTSDFAGRFLGPIQPAKYILHTQGAERDRILVRVQGNPKILEVQLDGDNTHWRIAPEEENNNEVVREINRERSQLPVSEPDFAAGVLQWYGLKK
ncbi:LTA synthase family protein [Simplicispira psychrophila]|uniref:LTA synthase family protein n=1 Tax=Simplicispira psychrophila TaxID=80882 RepID=UPI00146FB017|nr:sulfatase-like hydrolase/transferase [Simplicispira psychrophila]